MSPRKSSGHTHLMLSPTLLSKRLHEAIQAVQLHNWARVAQLLNANPWLAEMIDVTNQYLLHKLAYHGAGDEDYDENNVIAEPYLSFR